MQYLLLASLFVFAVWELILDFLPARTPAIVHPVLVFGLALGTDYIPDKILIAGAVAGAVGLIHLFARLMGATNEPVTYRLPRRSRGEKGLRGVGKRMPGLP